MDQRSGAFIVALVACFALAGSGLRGLEFGERPERTAGGESLRTMGEGRRPDACWIGGRDSTDAFAGSSDPLLASSTSERVEACYLAVSPRSDSVAVIIAREPKAQEVWLLTLDDVRWSRLCAGENFRSVSWDPRAGSLCLAVSRAGSRMVELQVFDTASGAGATAVQDLHIVAARWNPCRELIGYVCGRSITEFVPELRVLPVPAPESCSPEPVAVLAKWTSAWVWSGDGKRIFYSPRAEGGTWTFDVDTGERRKLWDFVISDTTAGCSPDGTRLLCYVPEPVSEDLIVSIPSGRWTTLFGRGAVVGDGAWSRDSAKLALLVKTGPAKADFRLFILNADGSHRKEIGAVKARTATGRLGWIPPRQLVVAYPDAILIFEEGRLTSVIALPR